MVWDIFDEMQRMQEEMNSIFGRFFSPSPYRQIGTTRAVQPVSESYRRAVADVQQTDTDVIVTAELPGMEKEDIDLTVHVDRVEIKAQTKKETTEEKEGFKTYGRAYAGFYQRIPLPAAVDSDKVKATYKNGVLEVVLPKTEVSKSPITIE